jgi:hypothetical protein
VEADLYTGVTDLMPQLDGGDKHEMSASVEKMSSEEQASRLNCALRKEYIQCCGDFKSVNRCEL